MKKKTILILLATLVLAFSACGGPEKEEDAAGTMDGKETETETDAGTEAGTGAEAGTNADTGKEEETGAGADTGKEEDAAGGMSEEELYDLAVRDAVFADEDEIMPLVSLTEGEELVSFDGEGRVLLCTWHNYPDSYPAGEDVTIEWGYVWTFTDKEMKSHAEELAGEEDPEMRLRQLISFAPGSEHSTVTGLWVNPEDVIRPAYQTDVTDGSMENAFDVDEEGDALVDEEFKEWFDENTLSSYFYGSYPWTRLGYTYDWADNGSEYGLTEFMVKPGATVHVEFTETTEEFLERLSQ